MRKPLRAVAVLLVCLSWVSGCGHDARPPDLGIVIDQMRVDQIDLMNVGNPPVNQANSQFGTLTVAFDAPAGTYFLQAASMSSTVDVQALNLPVTTPGGPHEFSLAIDLARQQPMPGDDVPTIMQAVRLTTEPVLTESYEFLNLPVGTETVTFQTGHLMQEPVLIPSTPPILFTYDGVAFTVDTEGHSTFTNQDCGVNECTPAAVSNSMKTIGVGTNTQNSISAVKPLVNWTAGGAPANWPTGKSAATSGAPYNLTTTVLDPKPQNAAQRIATLMAAQQALKDGKDVEMDNPWHTAMVTRITKSTSGGVTKYYIWVAHDTQQGAAGGTKEEVLEYDPATNSLDGGTPGFFNGSIIDQWVIESN